MNLDTEIPCEFGKRDGECRHPDVLIVIDGPFKTVLSELCREEICEDFEPNIIRVISSQLLRRNPHEEKQ